MATLLNDEVDTTGTEVAAVSMSILGIIFDAPIIVSMNLGTPDEWVDIKGEWYERGTELRQVGTGLKIRARSGTANVLVEDNQ